MNPAVTSEMSKKRAVDSESPLENESAKKRMVTIATVKKWIIENDKDITTSTWLVVAVDCPPLAQWDAIPAVRLWWKDKQRRQPTHDTRTPPIFKTTSAVTVSEPVPAYTFSLEDWDTFIEDYVNNA
eukprot:Em0001g737a